MATPSVKSKAPTSLDVAVGPYKYKVVHKSHVTEANEDGTLEVLVGLSDHDNQTVYINTDYCSDIQLDTLFHEVLHCVVYMTGLSERLKDDQEEEIVRSISPMLLWTLRENPQLLKYLGLKATQRA